MNTKKKITIITSIFLLIACSLYVGLKKIESDIRASGPINESDIDKDFEFTTEYNNSSLYDIYITDCKFEISLVQLSSLEKNNINHSVIRSVSHPYDTGMFMYLGKNSTEKVYVGFTKNSDGTRKNIDKLLTFKDGKYEGDLKLKTVENPNDIISDTENNKLFVQQNAAIQSDDSEGLNIDIFDTTTDEFIKTINIKGYIRSFSMNDTEIILNIEGASKLGFTDAPNRSIGIINRKTLDYECITEDSIPLSVVGVTGDEDNKIIFSNYDLNDSETINKPKVSTINEDNIITEKMSVEKQMYDCYYGNNNIEYLKSGGDSMENEGFLAFDKNKMEFIKKFDDKKNIVHIEETDGKLFALSRDGYLSIYEANNYDKLDTIYIGKNNVARFTVIKK